MKTIKKVVSILFSDIKGYSKIKNDESKKVLYEEFKKIQQRILTEDNHFYKNTWGDALLVCSYDYFDLANIALSLRDEFKKTNWKRLNLPDLSIRVGVHTQKITLDEQNNKVIDIIGSGVDETARIEPIVDPNKVFASKMFCEHLKEEENLNINITPLGKKQLAKDYKETELFELTWDYEEVNMISLDNKSFDIPVPNIKKEFTEEEKEIFVELSFSEIINYFKQASIKVEEKYSKVKILVEEVSTSKFICRLYLDRNEKNNCKIWFNKDRNSPFGRMTQISYAEGFYSVNDDGSMNDWVSAESDGFKLYFTKTNMYLGTLDDNLMNKETWMAEDAAKYFWLRFTENLKHIYL